MYTEIVNKMKKFDYYLENGKMGIEKIRQNGMEYQLNERINNELKSQSVVKNINDVMKITGATYGRKYKKY